MHLTNEMAKTHAITSHKQRQLITLPKLESFHEQGYLPITTGMALQISSQIINHVNFN